MTGPGTEKTFLVGGLFSEEGKKEVEHNLIQIDGVQQVNVSLSDSAVNVRYDPGVIRDEFLARTLDSLGYSPRVR
ncbi:MAG: heavy-metal-associated domain-containing protein [Firmicutes bacterium]|nr:heavy-metal-associated domain-containing protein [Bacillota bacterium]